MKWQILLADPPWGFSDQLKNSDTKRGASSNYNTMSLADIKALKVKEIADPNNSILLLWVPSSLLKSGIEVMESWGFEQKQIFIWHKTKKEPFKSIKSKLKASNSFKETWQILSDFDLNDISQFFMGHAFRSCAEVCLLGTRGDSVYKNLLKNKSQRNVMCAPNEKHSKKSTILHKRLEIMFKAPGINFIELFARDEYPAWTCIGNQVKSTLGEDIKNSLERLIQEDKNEQQSALQSTSSTDK